MNGIQAPPLVTVVWLDRKRQSAPKGGIFNAISDSTFWQGQLSRTSFSVPVHIPKAVVTQTVSLGHIHLILTEFSVKRQRIPAYTPRQDWFLRHSSSFGI